MKKLIKDIENKIGEEIRNNKFIDLDSISRKIHASPILVVKIMRDYEKRGMVTQI